MDREKVQKVVYEMSKGSRHFENEKRKEALVQQRVHHMQAQADLLTNDELANYEKVADAKITELEEKRDLSRTWMHVDLDAFYAAVETLENPSLAGKAVAVGGMSMICTANYEARKFGVRAAMPGFIGRRLCPDLIFVRPNFSKYAQYSEQVRQVFRKYDPQFLARSLDEAYLDITEQCRQRGISSGEIAEELRKCVHEKTGLTCSAGVGPNRMVAKVCSDMKKPNGQFVVPNERGAVMAFFSTLPIRKVSGIGKVTERLLKEVLGIVICDDLIKKRALITALFSSISSEFFLSVGLGIGGSETQEEEPRKSLSCERTFSATSCEKSLFAKLEELAENLSKDMETECLQGRTLTLKLKTINFEVRTRSLTLAFSIHKKEDLTFHASKLLKAELPLSLRLMGLRISHFQGDLADPSQRTIADFVCTSSAQSAKLSSSENSCQSYSTVCVGYNDCPQQVDCVRDEHIETCSSVVLPETDEIQAPSLTSSSGGFDAQIMLSPPIDSQWLCKTGYEIMSTSDRNPERGQLAYELEKYTKKSDCFFRRGIITCDADTQADLQADNYDTALESRFSGVMTWVDDHHCSLCGLEIPASLMIERQEHTDFHYAQILQQEYSNVGSVENAFGGLKEQSKRHSSSYIKERSSKKGNNGRAEGSKEKSRFVPIDAFFSRA